MTGAPVRKDSASKTASAVRRGSTSAGGGSYGVREGGSTIDAPAASGAFTRSWWKLYRTTSQPGFGLGLDISWQAEDSEGDTSWHGTGPPTTVPSVTVFEPYVAYLYLLTNTDPVDIHPEIHWNGPPVKCPFHKVGASAWEVRGSTVVIPGSSLSSVVVSGAGPTFDSVAIANAELLLYPL